MISGVRVKGWCFYFQIDDLCLFYVFVNVLYEIKWNEKLLTRLNHQCPKLRGAANPNQAYYRCPFTVRWSNMPENRGFRMEKPGRNIKVFIFFRNGCEDLDFFVSRGIQFQSCLAATENSPFTHLRAHSGKKTIDHQSNSSHYSSYHICFILAKKNVNFFSKISPDQWSYLTCICHWRIGSGYFGLISRSPMFICKLFSLALSIDRLAKCFYKLFSLTLSFAVMGSLSLSVSCLVWP